MCINIYCFTEICIECNCESKCQMKQRNCENSTIVGRCCCFLVDCMFTRMMRRSIRQKRLLGVAPYIEMFAKFRFYAQRMLAEMILEEIQLQIRTYWISNGNFCFSFVRVPNILDAKIKTNSIYFAIAMKLLRLSKRYSIFLCKHNSCKDNNETENVRKSERIGGA